ncbi:HD domain-containing protein [Amycolatopsis thermophila]|uniref:HD/PDEase domain-containing protein n=1 Tax=Amycolatopsis thermophila TaxID=206084 RepID=A0ABU0F203_9PSEU|nr:HD domain-containing protein [Amycolatopsis thermophila]MDQ0381201.1 hypothetical protein [Amycolatopsis thermophila]
MRLADVVLPDSAVCSAAVDVAETYASPALLNHSFRSYTWAAAYGTAQGLAFDPELLFVAALLHDIGLVAEFDSHTVPFEVAGGSVAWVFAAGAGWSRDRRRRVSEVVVRHMGTEVDPAQDPEGFLLARATGVDITGRNVDDFPAGFRAEVLQRYPRLGLVEEFVRCFEDQAKRKPDSSAAAAIGNDLAARMARNPLERPE